MQAKLAATEPVYISVFGIKVRCTTAECKRRVDKCCTKPARVAGRADQPNEGKLLGDNADLCGIAKLGKEVLVAFLGKAKRLGAKNRGFGLKNERPHR